MPTPRNRVAIVFEGVVVPWRPRSGGCFSVITANPVGVLASPFGRGVMR
ncbi:MAG: hypothetical protein FWH14_08570 [Oscillospiraceae bacterium]|nr:hypothetical protein [Oscillospiraceae bacterium]